MNQNKNAVALDFPIHRVAIASDMQPNHEYHSQSR